MTFDDIVAGQHVFLDANTFLYYFTAHFRFGSACHKLLSRIENKDLAGFTSAHVLTEVVHRLMTIEACQRFGWPAKGIARRLRRQPTEVQQLTRSRQAVDEITLIGLNLLPIDKSHMSVVPDISRQTGLLCGDAMVVAVMQVNGLTNLASNDTDFDRVSGINRYAPS
jgi:predicted nucleic acid-binding protein